MSQSSYKYLKIPIAWKTLYTTILKIMSDFGVDIIKDCNATCSDSGKKAIECWVTFNAACVAFAEDKITQAKILIEILVDCLNKRYKTDFNPDDYTDIETETYEYEFDPNVFKTIVNGDDEGYEFDENIFTVVIDEDSSEYSFDSNMFTTT